jgi:hypothetical protein
MPQKNEKLEYLIKHAGLSYLAKALGSNDAGFPSQWAEGSITPSSDHRNRLEVTHRHFAAISETHGLQTARAWLTDVAWLIAADRFEEVRVSAVRMLGHSSTPSHHPS